MTKIECDNRELADAVVERLRGRGILAVRFPTLAEYPYVVADADRDRVFAELNADLRKGSVLSEHSSASPFGGSETAGLL